MQTQRVCMSEAGDVNRQEWQCFFKSGRVVWTVTLRLRSLHGPQSKVSELVCVCVYCMHSCATLITAALMHSWTGEGGGAE